MCTATEESDAEELELSETLSYSSSPFIYTFLDFLENTYSFMRVWSVCYVFIQI